MKSTAPAPVRCPKHWLRRILFFTAALWVLDEGVSWLVDHSRLNGYLTARLETAFGRPVEVGRYEFSLLGGPQLEAEPITVAEDPRFGNEYFLRAESLRINLSWRALLRGRLELGTLSFTQPSLNLVRAADGQWNLANWLPRAAEIGLPRAASGLLARPVRVPHISRVEVDTGRIDFKHGADKLPFALIGVSGSIEQESPGRWRLDLEAQPARAAVVLQQAGTLHVRGLVGGTSSHLRPAMLELSWQDASLSDLLRLLSGSDHGVRAQLSLVLTAHTEGQQWAFLGRAEFRRVHRWDLPLRPDDPAVNLNVEARWLPESSRLELAQVVVEAPRSSLRATGFLGWTARAEPFRVPSRDARLQILSSGVQLSDVLSWFRAFHPGIADELSLRGFAGLDLSLGGWPPRIERGVLAIEGAQLEGGSLRAAVRVGRVVAQVSRDRFDLAPVTLAIGREAGSFRIEALARRRANWKFAARVVGRVEQVQKLVETAAALGWLLPHGWGVEGPADFDLRWQGEPSSSLAQPLGRIELGGVVLRTPFLNQTINQVKGRVKLQAGEWRITLTSAQAFGARWAGLLSRRDPAGPWGFTLAADHLSAAELDHWLNPRWREGLLERVLPFLSSSSGSAALPAGLRGQGRFSVNQFQLGPVALQRLSGDLDVEGRRVELSRAEAQFYGGAVRGSLRADLETEPSYSIKARFERVNLAALTASSASLRDRFSGNASGNIELETRGLRRSALSASLECRGSLRVRDAGIRGLDLAGSLRAAGLRTGASTFPLASAGFTCAAGKVQFPDLHLAGLGSDLEASGSVDFSRNLDIRIRALPPLLAGKNAPPLADVPRGTFRLAGTLDAPQVFRLAAKGRPRWGR